jgi:hypothetical protein
MPSNWLPFWASSSRSRHGLAVTACVLALGLSLGIAPQVRAQTPMAAPTMVQPSDTQASSWIQERKDRLGDRTNTSLAMLQQWFDDAMRLAAAPGRSPDSAGALYYFASGVQLEFCDRKIDDHKHGKLALEVLKQSVGVAPWRIESVRAMGRAAKALTELNATLRFLAKHFAGIDTDAEVDRALRLLVNPSFNSDPMCQLLLMRLGHYRLDHGPNHDQPETHEHTVALIADAEHQVATLRSEAPEAVEKAEAELKKDGDQVK